MGAVIGQIIDFFAAKPSENNLVENIKSEKNGVRIECCVNETLLLEEEEETT